MKMIRLASVLFASLLCSVQAFAAVDRGEQKQVFGQYEVHYIGLTSSFLDAETAAAKQAELEKATGKQVRLMSAAAHQGTDAILRELWQSIKKYREIDETMNGGQESAPALSSSHCAGQ